MNTKSSGGTQAGNTGYCGFVVGQHVVCVDASDPDDNGGWHAKRGIKFGLVRNRVYTVARVYVARGFYRGEVAERVVVELEELKKPPAPHEPGSNGFAVERFRPLQKLKIEDFMSAPVDGERVSA